MFSVTGAAVAAGADVVVLPLPEDVLAGLLVVVGFFVGFGVGFGEGVGVG